jgi:hypothetical protein
MKKIKYYEYKQSFLRRHDNQHNETRHKGFISGIQHNDTQPNNTLPLCWMSLDWVSSFIVTLNVIMLSVAVSFLRLHRTANVVGITTIFNYKDCGFKSGHGERKQKNIILIKSYTISLIQKRFVINFKRAKKYESLFWEQEWPLSMIWRCCRGTSLYLLHNLRIDRIRKCVWSWQAFANKSNVCE